MSEHEINDVFKSEFNLNFRKTKHFSAPAYMFKMITVVLIVVQVAYKSMSGIVTFGISANQSSG